MGVSAIDFDRDLVSEEAFSRWCITEQRREDAARSLSQPPSVSPPVTGVERSEKASIAKVSSESIDDEYTGITEEGLSAKWRAEDQRKNLDHNDLSAVTLPGQWRPEKSPVTSTSGAGRDPLPDYITNGTITEETLAFIWRAEEQLRKRD